MADIKEKTTGGNGKIVAGILAAGTTSYIMNWCSLNGIDFAVLGVDSEIVKASLIGTLSGVFVGLTPQHVVQETIDIILFVRASYQRIVQAATSDKIEQPKE